MSRVHKFSTAIREAPAGACNMSARQKSGTGAMVELEDEKVRKNDILSNSEKAQRLSEQSLDGAGVQIDEYKDIPTNQRPKDDDSQVKSYERTTDKAVTLG